MRKQLFIGVMALGFCSGALASGVQYAPPAPAAPAWNPGVYLGLQAGYGMTYWDNLPSAHFSVKDEDGFAGRVYLGYDFHPNFAIEAGYTMWFNEPKINGVKGDYPWAIDLVGKIKAHVVDQFGLYAKAGVDYLYSKQNANTNKDSFNVVYGVGAFYDFTPNISADLSWTRYGGSSKFNNDYAPYMDLFALGVQYKFDLG